MNPYSFVTTLSPLVLIHFLFGYLDEVLASGEKIPDLEIYTAFCARSDWKALLQIPNFRAKHEEVFGREKFERFLMPFLFKDHQQETA